MKNCFCFDANNPFLVIKRWHSLDQNETLYSVRVYSSQHHNETKEPLWIIKGLKVQSLWNSNYNRPIEFEVWSHKEDGDHKLYGGFQTYLNEILSKDKKQFSMSNKKRGHAGSLEFTQFIVFDRPSMIDYLKSGWAISLSVAIDFTASNGELSDPTSLHYIDNDNPSKMSPYEEAIYSPI